MDRCFSLSVYANSSTKPPLRALSYAAVMFPKLTDFDPKLDRIQLELGKLIPIGELGDTSPPSMATLTTL